MPTIWNDVLRRLESYPGHDISSLRLVTCGGSAVPVSMMKAFEDARRSIVQAWGMTETSPVATVARPLPGLPTSSSGRLRASQGRPLCGVEVRVVDDAGNPLPHDGKAVGEIEVRGPWVTGVLLPAIATTSKFDDGWLRTGDVGRIDPLGYVTLTDRAKDVIKSGGEWISSVELENHLIAHPAVLEAAVVAVPDERWQERPLAVVVVNEGADGLARRNCGSSWATRWFAGGCPSGGRSSTEVPRTSVGKYDKKTIRARYAEDAYDVVEHRD